MTVGTTTLSNQSAIILDGVDFSGDLNDTKMDFTQAEIDVSTFGTSGWKKKIVSISDGSISISGFGQKTGHTLDAKLNSMLGAPINPGTLEVDIPSSAVGAVRYTQSVFLKSASTDVKVNDAYKLSAAFSITGSPIRALITS